MEAKVKKRSKGQYLPGLRRAREDAALSQRDLAALSGLSQLTINDLEKGYRGAYFSTIRKLSRALGVPPRTLMEEPKREVGAA